MASAKNRREVEQNLQSALNSDKAHFDITGISRFGIVEMTRERLRSAYLDTMHTACATCSGAGIVRSDMAVAIAALREMHTRASSGGIKSVTCRLPVESLNYLMNTKRKSIFDLEKSFHITINVIADVKLSGGQYSVEVEKKEPHEEKEPAAEGE